MNNQQLAVLADSMELFKKINETTQDVFWAIDKTGCFIYVSPSVFSQRGFPADEVIGQSALDFIYAEDRPQVQQMFTLGLEIIDKGLTRLPAGRVRVRQPHKNGTIIWTEVVSEFFFDDEREFLFVLGVTRNLSELVAAEEEIARLRQELAQK